MSAETVNRDAEHLNLLALFHYIVGGVIALFACIPIIHVIIGLAMIYSPESMTSSDSSGQSQFLIGWVFVATAALCILLGWTMALLVFLSGRFLARRKHFLFCVVIAAVNCMFFPFGTVLGVFTLIVLMRPGVKEMFVQPAT